MASAAEITATEPAARDAAIAEIRAVLGDRLTIAMAVREQHGKGEAYHKPAPPDAVAFVESTEEVVAVVKACAKYRIPVIPFGAGTALEGHTAALHGGICVDVTRMNKVLAVNTSDLDVRVQPGVTRKQLNEYLRDTGLFFPIDPGADASIGGMTATRASGTNAVRYGTMRENVLSLEVVTADGRVVRTSRRARKSSAGYDLTRLFVGSEGTLGVITEITVKVYGIPEATSSAMCAFPDVKSAVDTCIATIQAGIPVARIELADKLQMEAIAAYSKINIPAAPTLWLEFHGSETGVKEQAEFVQAIAAEHGGEDFRWTTDPAERKKIWQARHDAAYASKGLRQGCSIWATDVCVPISRLADCIVETQADLDASFIPAPIVGHVGDGNFHLCFVLNMD
ncbi:MAG: FAD-binding protein, partial [Alphaproteobacteria bacterium]|nr:FAD-binding protein [Alphaproteobacteria bacterium]